MGLFKKDPNEEFLKNADLTYRVMLMVPVMEYNTAKDTYGVSGNLNDLEKCQYLEEQCKPFKIKIELEDQVLWDGPPKVTVLPTTDKICTICHIMAMAYVSYEFPVSGPNLKIKPVNGKVTVQTEYAAEQKPTNIVISPNTISMSKLPAGYTFCRPGLWSASAINKPEKWTCRTEKKMLKEYLYLEQMGLGYHKTGDNSATFSGAYLCDLLNVGLTKWMSNPCTFDGWSSVPSNWKLPDWRKCEYREIGKYIEFTGKFL